jgi:predicted amidohydrolase
MSNKKRVAAAHAAPVLLDAEASTAKACDWIAKGTDDNIDLLVFPEVFIPGFPYWINCYPPLVQPGLTAEYQAASITVPGPEIAAVQSAAADAGVAVILGISERDANSYTCFNSLVFIEKDGTIAGVHRKLQPTFAERTVWGQGDGSTLFVLDMAAGKVGGLACWEHTMYLARQALVAQGEQIHAGAWPALSTMAGFESVADDQIEAMMRSHAIMAQCFVVCASSPVTEEMIARMESALEPQPFVKPGGGWSAVIHPMTPYLAGPHQGMEEKLLVAEIDLDEIIATKVFVDGAGHYARPEVLRLYLDDEPKPVMARSTAASAGVAANEGNDRRTKTGDDQ